MSLYEKTQKRIENEKSDKLTYKKLALDLGIPEKFAKYYTIQCVISSAVRTLVAECNDYELKQYMYERYKQGDLIDSEFYDIYYNKLLTMLIKEFNNVKFLNENDIKIRLTSDGIRTKDHLAIFFDEKEEKLFIQAFGNGPVGSYAHLMFSEYSIENDNLKEKTSRCALEKNLKFAIPSYLSVYRYDEGGTQLSVVSSFSGRAMFEPELDEEITFSPKSR